MTTVIRVLGLWLQWQGLVTVGTTGGLLWGQQEGFGLWAEGEMDLWHHSAYIVCHQPPHLRNCLGSIFLIWHRRILGKNLYSIGSP